MSYVDVAIQYSDDIKNGVIPACVYVKLAIDRFDRMLLSAYSGNDEYWFDPDHAERVCEQLEKFPHVKGRWAAKKELFKLSPWQIFGNINLFGFKRVKEGEQRNIRLFREAYFEVPRKNGKTFWIAGIGLVTLIEDGEYGAEIYCGATTEKQALEVFTPAKAICNREDELREKYGVEVNAKSITVPSNGSKFEPIIGDPGDGSSPHVAIADEYHEHPNSDQVDTMITGMGAREQPLMLYITTAGSNMGGPCYEKRNEIKQILSGTVEDNSVFGIIYTIDDDDDWDSPEALKKANPNYDVSVSGDFLLGQLNQARRTARKQTAYRTKHLNQWVGAKAAWMNMLAVQACRKKKNTLKQFKGRDILVAFDLASKIDIASRAVLIPGANNGKHAAFCRHYLPEDVINESDKYSAWHKDGWLVSTPGNIIDFEYIEDDLKQLGRDYSVLEVAYDPYQATQFSTRMTDEGFEMIEVGAQVKNFSEPMKELEKLILSRQIVFDMDPVLFWMFGNVVAKEDQKENIFPNKERKENKIDGVVALIMAMNRLMNMEQTGSLADYLASVGSKGE